jgi:hypothetical protein
VHGKDALRTYWTMALQRVPDLQFELLGVYVGVSAIVINYRNQTGASVNEVLIFGEDGLVSEGHGTYVAGTLQSRSTPSSCLAKSPEYESVSPTLRGERCRTPLPLKRSWMSISGWGG